MASRRLEVVIAGDASGAQKAFAQTEKSAGGFKSKMAGVSKSMMKFGGAMTAGVTLPIAAALTVAVKAATEEEKAQVLLANTLRKTTGATKTQIDAVEDWVTKTQNATGVMDDELRPALQKFLIAGRSTTQAQKDLNVALDIAAARGKPVATVVEAMSKAAKGNVGALGRLGIATKNAAGETLSYDEVLKEASRTMGGQAAAAADTTAGKAAIMAAKFEDVKESIGSSLLPILTDFADTLSGLADRFSKLTPAQQKWIAIGVAALAVIGPLSVAIGGLVTVIGLLISPIGLAVVAIAAIAAGLYYAYNNIDGFRERVDLLVAAAKVAWPQVQAAAVTALYYIQQVTTVVLNYIQTYWDLFGRRLFDNAQRAFRMIQGVIGVAMNIIRGIVQVVTNIMRGDWSGALDAILRTTQRVWSGVIGVVQNAVGVIRNLVSGLAQIMRSVFDGVAGAVRGAANAAKNAWNSTIGGRGIKIPGFDPPGPGPSFGGFSMSIPRLHSGGVFRAPRSGGEGLALLKDREIVLTPGQQQRSMGNTYNFTIVESKDARDTARQVEAIIRREAAFAGATAGT